MKAADLMTSDFELVSEDATLLDAMAHLREAPGCGDEVGIKCVPVVDGSGKLCGVLTQSDVVSHLLYPYFVRDLASRTESAPEFKSSDYEALATWASRVAVGDIMSKDVHTIAPTADAFEAADLLLRHRVKSLPVVQEGEVVGILYRSTLYRRLTELILANARRDDAGTPAEPQPS